MVDSVTLIIPKHVLGPMMDHIPVTHEVGGEVQYSVNPSGNTWTATRMVAVKGEACRDQRGRIISKDAPCSIRKPDYTVSFHTHPKSNTPSSADLRNSIFKSPRMRRYGGKRRLSIVVTRKGVWVYYPTPDRIEKWQRRTHRDPEVRAEVRRWSQYKRTHRSKTDVIRYMKSRGVVMHYFPRAHVLSRPALVIPFYTPISRA